MRADATVRVRLYGKGEVAQGVGGAGVDESVAAVRDPEQYAFGLEYVAGNEFHAAEAALA